MDAKEFFEKNRGQYFYFEGEKVRVVGYEESNPSILVTKKEGWDLRSIQSTLIDYIDESLISKNDGLWFVKEDEINPIEQPELDLCKLLEGCEGIELWSDIFGKCKLLNTKLDGSYKIEVEVIDKDKDEDGIEIFTQDGKFYTGYPNAKCMLWPSETNRDWSTFVRPKKIKDGTPVMCSNGDGWFLREYAGGKEVALDEGKLVGATVTAKYIVPATEFDFTDLDSNKSKSII